ncbi:MAG: hypothetical protein SGI74_13840 [Oligoflexia bacterium]|nr:hypothetical protein [Oligoflexia bacterium]
MEQSIVGIAQTSLWRLGVRTEKLRIYVFRIFTMIYLSFRDTLFYQKQSVRSVSIAIMNQVY